MANITKRKQIQLKGIAVAKRSHSKMREIKTRGWVEEAREPCNVE
jgi:hypothetical protein